MVNFKDSRSWSAIWRQRARLIGPYAFMCFSLLTINYSLLTSALAQEEPVEQAPPPLKAMSKNEISLLAAKTDMKDRTKASLDLMNARLLAAEKLGTAEDFDGVFREFGGFVALMDDALQYLKKRDSGSGKVLDNFKRMEIGLRGMAPRIEVIRRELPPRYDDYVRKLSAYLRDARAKATETLFDDSVVPVKKPN